MGDLLATAADTVAQVAPQCRGAAAVVVVALVVGVGIGVLIERWIR